MLKDFNRAPAQSSLSFSNARILSRFSSPSARKRSAASLMSSDEVFVCFFLPVPVFPGAAIRPADRFTFCLRPVFSFFSCFTGVSASPVFSVSPVFPVSLASPVFLSVFSAFPAFSSYPCRVFHLPGSGLFSAKPRSVLRTV